MAATLLEDPSMKMPLSFALAAGLLLAPSTAQLTPLPGIPIVPPPVPHPALAAQPLIGDDAPAKRPAAKPVKVEAHKKAPVDPATRGVKKKGRDLKKAVKKVKELSWLKKLDAATATARASGKPVLLLQTLGDISGFA
jgi:hypothetical protein